MASLGSFGLWGLFTKLSVNVVDSRTAFVYQALGVILAAIISIFYYHSKLQISGIGLIYSLLIGITYSLGCLYYFEAASKGSISTVVTITALYPLVTILLSVLLLKESLNIRQILGIVFALISMLFFTKS